MNSFTYRSGLAAKLMTPPLALLVTLLWTSLGLLIYYLFRNEPAQGILALFLSVIFLIGCTHLALLWKLTWRGLAQRLTFTDETVTLRAFPRKEETFSRADFDRYQYVYAPSRFRPLLGIMLSHSGDGKMLFIPAVSRTGWQQVEQWCKERYKEF